MPPVSRPFQAGLLLPPSLGQGFNWHGRLKDYGVPASAFASTLGWMAVIMVFLGTSDPPGPSIPYAPVKILGHLFLFTVYGFLVSVSAAYVARFKGAILNLLAVVLVGCLWAIFTEWYQTTVPGRHASPGDVLIDVVGSATGGSIAWAVKLWIARRARGVV